MASRQSGPEGLNQLGHRWAGEVGVACWGALAGAGECRLARGSGRYVQLGGAGAQGVERRKATVPGGQRGGFVRVGGAVR